MPHSEFLQLLCLELTEMERPRQTPVCMEVPVSRGNIGALMETERGITHSTFQGTGVLPKSFSFDFFTAGLAS